MKKVFFNAAIAVFLFGCVPTAVRIVAANPYSIGIFRLSVGVIFLTFLVTIRREIKSLSLKQLKPLLLLGLIFFLHWLTYFWSIKLASASLGAVGLATYGIHLIALGCVVRREPPTIVDLLGVFMAFTGTLLNVPEFSLASEQTRGLFLGISSGFFYALLPIIHQKNKHISNNIRTLGQLGFALVFFLFFWGETNWNLSGGDWGILVFLAVGCTVIAHTAWVNATTALSTATTSLVYYGYVFVSIIIANIVLNEEITQRMLVGALLIFFGIFIALHSQKKRGGLLS